MSSSASSAVNSDSEPEDLKKYIQAGMESSASSAAPSVDTDAESGPDEVPVNQPVHVAATADAALRRHLQEGLRSDSEGDGEADSNPAASALAAASSSDPAASAPAAASSSAAGVGVRHASGTWKIAEYPWFYITKHPDYTDVKILARGPLRQASSGLGSAGLSKALTPSHYGDTSADPWRTVILLRAWSFWRVREGGWVSLREARVRMYAAELSSLEADIRARLPDGFEAPLFGSDRAHQLFKKWVPELFARFFPVDHFRPPWRFLLCFPFRLFFFELCAERGPREKNRPSCRFHLSLTSYDDISSSCKFWCYIMI